MKSYSEACDRNKTPILKVIRSLLENRKEVLEIGSGTGQHAVYFAQQMPHLVWYTSDRAMNHAAINDWIESAALANVRPPQLLDVAMEVWPSMTVDVIFSANTAHIMSMQEVIELFAGVGRLLLSDGLFLLYGPFNYGNQYSSDSNRLFDQRLKMADPLSGIRDFEVLDQLATQAGMVLLEDYDMPANNRLLCWQKC